MLPNLCSSLKMVTFKIHKLRLVSQKQSCQAQFFVGIATIQHSVDGEIFVSPEFLKASLISLKSFSFGL